MTPKKIANLVLTIGLLSFGAASCDILDPWDPGNGGGNGGGGNGGGGCDTVVNQPEQLVKAVGTVRLVTDRDGSTYYGIEATDGVKYEPINLSESFQQDGLKVNFAGYLLQDWASIHEYGQLVEIIEIYNAD